ncbi:hypothetical protein B0H63DRAFT_402445 [Podospora didyma]|uniref:UBC core domain-containing protein n=1 Tax=Podospora didyma TaxID=330526 RepID=A0AAE0K6H3_9PEZI|nr:hypothetical protein B0H63DRAFT_402445 [Podospora didyma]
MAHALQHEQETEQPPKRPSLVGTVVLGGIEDLVQPLGSEADLQAYKDSLRETQCSKCGTDIKIDGASIVSRTKTALKQDVGTLHPWIRCPRCKYLSCVSCDASGRTNPARLRYQFRGKRSLLTWCCDEGRLFLIWSLLCGTEFRKQPNNEIPNTAVTDRLRPRKSKADLPSPTKPATPEKATEKRPTKPHKPPRPKESQLSKGVGYGGPLGPTHSLPGSKNKGQGLSKAAIKYDEALEQYFSALSLVLPGNPTRDGAGNPTQDGGKQLDFDLHRQPVVSALIPRSPLLLKACEVLRNDSVEEIGLHMDLVAAILDFLEAMNRHPDTIPFLYRAQILFPQAQQLIYYTFSPTETQTTGSTMSQETVQPVNAVLRRLTIPCQFYSQAALKIDDLGTPEDQQLIALTVRICAVAEEQEKNRLTHGSDQQQSELGDTSAKPLPDAPAKTRLQSRNAKISQETNRTDLDHVQKKASDFHREYCVAEVEDEKIFESFYFAEKARSISKESSAKGRMKKLVTQVTSLQTDLPEGIFVRHGASRLDVMKVLIVGPSDTPYEHGLFEFDLFCTNDFPRKAPEMQFRTTGGGRVGFNPNLYAVGKVCFSLLGTWSGQAWDPEHSTLLQLLVSIQAMIFNDQPWYNEPGRENRIDDKASGDYNMEIQRMTIQHAMTYWLKDRLGQPNKGKAPAVAQKPSLTADNKKGNPSSLHPLPVPPHVPSKKPPSLLPVPPSIPKGVSLPYSVFKSGQHWANSPALKAAMQSSKSAHPSKLSQVSQVSEGSQPSHVSQPSQSPQTPQAPQISSESAMTFFGAHPLLTTHFSAIMCLCPETPPVLHLRPPSRRSLSSTRIFSPAPFPYPPANDDYIWGKIIRNHFGLKADMIMATVKKWQRTANWGVSPTGSKLISELEESFRTHGFQ